jgi:hypothetical protein
MGASLQAQQGLLIVEKVTSGSTSQTSQIQMERTRMRADTTGASGEKQVLVFDGAKQVLTLIDPVKKTYAQVTKADVDRLSAQMSEQLKKMQEQSAMLSPQQREQIAAVVKGRMGGPAKLDYRKTGKATVGKWTCDTYDGYNAGQKIVELCTVDPKVLGFTASDFAVSNQMVEFFRGLVPQVANQMFTVGNNEQQGFSGIPVRRTFTIVGRPSTAETTEITHKTFPESTFTIPLGYTRTPFGGFGGAARGRGRS